MKSFDKQQILTILREAQPLAAPDSICLKHGISLADFYRWQVRYEDYLAEMGGSKPCDLNKQIDVNPDYTGLLPPDDA